MDTIFEKNYKNCEIKVVEVTKKPEKLFDIIKNDLNEYEIINYRSIKNTKRKTEWLTVRILLKQILGKYSEIKYNHAGNPFTGSKFHISITHSQNIVGIIISKNPNIGIDSEIISNRILRTAHKFICEEELRQFSDDQKLKKIYLNWCGKETLFKIKGGGGIDFKENLKINIPRLYTSGIITGIYKKLSVIEEYKISYLFKKVKDKELLITWHSS